MEEGVDLIDLREDLKRGVSLKTEKAARRVPLHSRLIDLGFLAYVAGVAAARQVRGGAEAATPLFPHVPDVTSVSRFFRLTMEAVGIAGKQWSLHSARHTLSTMLDEANVSEKVRFSLLGWQRQGVGNVVYGHAKVTARELKDAIETVRF